MLESVNTEDKDLEEPDVHINDVEESDPDLDW